MVIMSTVSTTEYISNIWYGAAIYIYIEEMCHNVQNIHASHQIDTIRNMS